MSIYVDFSGRPFHFIGIGGIGMSALAYILAKRNLPTYGSDLKSSHITKRLQAIGTHIFWDQDAKNLELFQQISQEKNLSPSNDLNLNLPPIDLRLNAEALKREKRNGRMEDNQEISELPQVICSTAINQTNSEYKAAISLGCPILHRSDLLAALIQEYQSIAVAGTHGKTTTSSLIGFMLLETGLDPTIVIGGEVDAWEGNARLGNSPYLVAEADESDGSLIKLSAHIGVVTNIELDHPDHYESLDQVVETFKVFKENCQTLVGCIDCSTVKNFLQPTISYSLDSDSNADYTVDCVDYQSHVTLARVWERGQILGELQLGLLGKHNLSNALAAVAVGRLLGLEFPAIAMAIAKFEGAHRRFENRGECNGIVFIDDYAHHPSEVSATLAAARLRKNSQKVTTKSHISTTSLSLTKQNNSSPIQRVVAIFQPHRHSRTQAFVSEFAKSFNDADMVIVTDIYSAGESPLGKITGQQVAEAISGYHQQVYYQPSLESVSKFLNEVLRPGDLAIFLGAGNLNKIIPEVMAYYQKPHYQVVSIETAYIEEHSVELANS
ncbi:MULTISPECIES: UDP-N-acetylmuramate--L-alanine ligase [unclassified Okeania]|uniref:UDP-N-acetylmuramate--L-alanine ligase n=1 Tax=unclassified Okeania TaxID=2634635 RepID=UPI0013BD1707|nr:MULTISPECIES: UDP-N-acetylmuramate--L-alanine ligase [unclassified Okeania]NES75102.1 UDP-N-acetylmuramate--L-alanine ligase [Okeania sp. SIO1H4]NET13639.1 UDP-N-acetylmuramate--L-alanine ligase [Okeania sp. SIO1H6]NET22294.1 UDP-N-acetylmuramate--L-alanine ligase [Okeania sp. SIO1H5]NET96866.1 UDP-N-acetylmuramate--L-alanine ligase [Okeania sp. SIO1H2]